MKCPECAYHQQVSKGMKCAKCGYRFYLNPKEPKSYGMTDGRFLAAIRSAGQNGTAYFTKNQLYAAYCRQQKVSRTPTIIGIIIATVVAILLWVSIPGPLALLPAFLAFILLFPLFSSPHTVPLQSFLSLIERWLNVGKPIDNLIQGPALHQPPPEWNENDIYDYGVERILIVQHDELVDLMVLNNAHAEQSMLVISESGYPQYLLPHAKRLLQERADLPIYLLHDADSVGRSMHSRIGRLNLPIDNHPVIDLGMSAEDFKRLKRTHTFDQKSRGRELPVDALATPFLLTGLGACFATQTTMSALLAEHARESAVASSSSSFG